MAIKHQPVLIVGGSGIVGSRAAHTLRRLHPDLRVAIGGRNLERAQKTAQKVGTAEAVKVDVSQPNLGLTDQPFSAVVMFAKDDTLNGLKYAQARRIPYIGISSGVFEVGPEMALHIHAPERAPILMGSQWLVGAATLPTLEFAREFESLESIELAAVFDEQDMGGPAAAADFERLTKAAPSPLILKDGKWRWINGEEATRQVKDRDGAVRDAATYTPLDVLSLATATNAKSIRFDLVYGESATRKRGEPFSTEIIIELKGRLKNGQEGSARYELFHPGGQAPVTALSVAIVVERLLGLAGGEKVEPGLYFPESLIEPAYALRRHQEFGMEVRRAA
ncbi:MAG TPA: hypothetical protein VJ790_01905 [Dongiaceae bacterium]|nr:hypothetical protein [Dongiaceae bacterium]